MGAFRRSKNALTLIDPPYFLFFTTIYHRVCGTGKVGWGNSYVELLLIKYFETNIDRPFDAVFGPATVGIPCRRRRIYLNSEHLL